MDVCFSHRGSDRTLTIPAFWDGGDRFVVRFAPPNPGRISTLSPLGGMDARWYNPRIGEFQAAALPVREADGYWALPPKGGDGHTYPGATAPFGMVQLSPDTHNSGWEAASGYRDKDTTLIGFSHTHLSGTGGVDLGDFLFTPFPEPVPFSKQNETAAPGYYRVRVQDITVELTALPRTGCQRYTFQGEGERKLWVDLRYNIGDTHPDRISFGCFSQRHSPSLSSPAIPTGKTAIY